jgi:adenylate cyclase
LGYGAVFYKYIENKIWNGYQIYGISSTDRRPNTILIAVDEASRNQAEQESGTPWPWSRARILKLVQILLNEYQVQMVGFDMVFDSNTPKDIAANQALLKLAQEYKIVFAQAFTTPASEMGKSELNTLGQNPTVGHLGAAIQPNNIQTNLLKNVQIPQASGYIANNAILAEAPCIGHITPKKDRDGINSVPAFMQWQGRIYPSFALEMLRCLMREEYSLQAVNSNSAQYQSLNVLLSQQLLLDTEGYLRVPYRISLKNIINYQTISAADIFDKKENIAELLKNQIVIIAGVAFGMGDRQTTPQGVNVIGATIHIQLIEWLLDLEEVLPVQSMDLLMGLWILISILTLYFMLFKGVSVFYLLLCNISFAVTWVGLGYYVWIMYQWWLPVLPLFAYVFFAMFQIPIEWAITQHWAKYLRQLFQGYLPAPVVNSLVHNNDKSIIEPKRRELTILFADIANFTQRAEACKPEKIAVLTQKILEGLTQVVYECEGTLDKYMGDAVMAFWNAPLKQTHHADLAVQASIKMMKIIQEFNQDYVDDVKFDPINIRIGIHTGTVIVGDLGTKYRHAYTALGDAVNVAARLQEKAKDLHENILISENTVAALHDYCPLANKQSISLRGRKKEVGIYAISAHNHLLK